MEVQRFCKAALLTASIFALLIAPACTQNPLTGQSEFTGLMPAEQEASIGAAEHEKIVKQYGGIYNNTDIQIYVDKVGQSVAKYSERADVTYRFTVLDSPVVNAFALPGGYVYVTRGTLAVANSEAELAAVLGHEVGHVAARHQAARYSRGVLTQLGASVIGAAIGVPAASQALGLGSNLYMSSYSRDQETQADQLGVRYLSKSGYDTLGMSNFLRDMNMYQTVAAKTEGKEEQQFSYFSSHPDTAGRVQVARAEAAKYQTPQNAKRDAEKYLSVIRGMPYGDSAEQGFVRGGTFYHPGVGFAFDVPSNLRVNNQPQNIVLEGQGGVVTILDLAGANGAGSASDFVRNVWLKNRAPNVTVEQMSVNGLPAATAAVDVNVNNQPASIRLIAIEWASGQFVRMQILIPQGAPSGAVDDMKRMSYSFRKMTTSDKQNVKPHVIDVVTAGAGDTVQSMGARMGVDKLKAETFAALNGLTPASPIEAGRKYKIVR